MRLSFSKYGKNNKQSILARSYSISGCKQCCFLEIYNAFRMTDFEKLLHRRLKKGKGDLYYESNFFFLVFNSFFPCSFWTLDITLMYETCSTARGSTG